MASLSLKPLGVSWWSVPAGCPGPCCQAGALLGGVAEGRCTTGLFRGLAGEAASEARGLAGKLPPAPACMLAQGQDSGLRVEG